jgi:hypothetical protein
VLVVKNLQKTIRIHVFNFVEVAPIRPKEWFIHQIHPIPALEYRSSALADHYRANKIASGAAARKFATNLHILFSAELPRRRSGLLLRRSNRQGKTSQSFWKISKRLHKLLRFR